MTTTISFPTRDCIVVGCDSLATTSRPLINPFDLMDEFFDNGKLRLDENGDPILNSPSDIGKLIEHVPYNQMPDVIKLYHLEPADIAVLHAGATIIGVKSVKNIIEEFLADQQIGAYLSTDYTIAEVTKKLFAYLRKPYNAAFRNRKFPPEIELIVSGYSSKYRQPEIRKIILGSTCEIRLEVDRGKFSIVFGGQQDVIQRVVFGVDEKGLSYILERVNDLEVKYHALLSDFLKRKKSDIQLPKPAKFKDLKFLDKEKAWPFSGISIDELKNFSEQAAINFVDFLIHIMIMAQQFNNKMPTVGGVVQLAIVNKQEGFKWISKQEYRYKDYGVPKHEKSRK